MKNQIYLSIKKVPLFIILLIVFFRIQNVQAQVINEVVTWPDSNWEVVGSFSASGFNHNPSDNIYTTPTPGDAFGFDNQVAGSESLFDIIKVESPRYDLRPATVSSPAEEQVVVSFDYVYYQLGSLLTLQYSINSSGVWTDWEEINGNSSSDLDYKDCSGYLSFQSTPLLITQFDEGQLQNFRFRILFDDNSASFQLGGFCMGAPTLQSMETPLCFGVSNINTDSTTITHESAVINWQDQNRNPPNDGWEIEYGETGFTQGSGITVSALSNPYTINGLEDTTCYDVYVRAICDSASNIASDWVGPYNFCTINGPTGCGDYFYDIGGADGNYNNSMDEVTTICPDNTGDVVTVQFFDFELEENMDYLKVYDGSNVDATLLGIYTGLDYPPTFTATNTDGCLTFEFNSESSVTKKGWKANIICSHAPQCNAPVNLKNSTNSETNTTIDISWNDTNPIQPTEWQIAVMLSSENMPANSDFNTITPAFYNNTYHYTITNLDGYNNYNYYIRSKCGDDSYSFWSKQYCKSLGCETPNYFYNYNFDNNSIEVTLYYDNPLSINNVNSFKLYDIIGTSHTTIVDDIVLDEFGFFTINLPISYQDIFTYDGTNPYVLNLDINCKGDINTLNIIGEKDRYGFSLKCYNNGDVIVSFESTWIDNWFSYSDSCNLGYYIEYTLDPTDPSSFHVVDTNGETDYFIVTGLEYGDYYFFVSQYSRCSNTGYEYNYGSNLLGNPFTVNKDNCSGDICLQPRNLEIINRTDNSVELDWNDENTPTPQDGWEIEYGAPGFAIGTGTVISTTSHPFTINGLDLIKNEYEFYVKSNCVNPGDSVWTGPVSTDSDEECLGPAYFMLDEMVSNGDNYDYTFSWIDMNETPATSWQIEYGDTGFTQGSGTLVNVSANPATISLPDDDAHDFYIRTDCGDSLFSSWVGPLSNKCVEPINFEVSKSGNEYTLTWEDNSSPAFETWRFKYINLENSAVTYFTADDDVIVDSNIFTLTITITETSTQSFAFYIHKHCYSSCDSCPGGPGGPGGPDGWIGPATPIDSPDCPEPIDFSIVDSATTDTTIDLTWTPQGSETAWEVAYALDGSSFNPPEGNMEGGIVLTTYLNPYTVRDLLPANTYNFWVRAICTDSDFSKWVGPIIGVTSCSNCNSFKPEINKTYIVSGWVKEDHTKITSLDCNAKEEHIKLMLNTLVADYRDGGIPNGYQPEGLINLIHDQATLPVDDRPFHEELIQKASSSNHPEDGSTVDPQGKPAIYNFYFNEEQQRFQFQFVKGEIDWSDNILKNPGAESGTAFWTGQIHSLLNAKCTSVPPHTGDRNFQVSNGGICRNSTNHDGKASQVIEISDDLNFLLQRNIIDNGDAKVKFGGYLRDYDGNDEPKMFMKFKDDNDNLISSTLESELSSTVGYWGLKEMTLVIPKYTRKLELVLIGDKHHGSDNDSYFDDLFVQIGYPLESDNMQNFDVGCLEDDYGDISGVIDVSHYPFSNYYFNIDYVCEQFPTTRHNKYNYGENTFKFKESITNIVNQVYTYRYAHIKLTFINIDNDIIESKTFGTDENEPIIDGWQRIIGSFTIPESTAIVKVELVNEAHTTDNGEDLDINDPSYYLGDAFFDDIRIHPINGNMKSFVYDQITQKLMAELDENNFATFYEYDKEGGLIRVKKETEKGVFTIQETRSGNAKK